MSIMGGSLIVAASAYVYIVGGVMSASAPGQLPGNEKQII